MDKVPKILETLLESLLASCEIQSWNIYDESNGKCTVKIRFTSHRSDIVPKSTYVSYKKTSARQAERNRNRALAHNKSSMKCANVNMSKIGSESEMSIEQKRDTSSVTDNSFVISPIHVSEDKDISTVSNDVMSSPIECHGLTDKYENKQDSAMCVPNQLIGIRPCETAISVASDIHVYNNHDDVLSEPFNLLPLNKSDDNISVTSPLASGESESSESENGHGESVLSDEQKITDGLNIIMSQLSELTGITTIMQKVNKDVTDLASSLEASVNDFDDGTMPERDKLLV